MNMDFSSYQEFLEYKQFLALKNGQQEVPKEVTKNPVVLIEEQKPVAEEIPRSSEGVVIDQGDFSCTPIRIPVKLDRAEILSGIHKVLQDSKKYMTIPLILEKMTKLLKFNNIMAEELSNCLNASILGGDEKFKRCMIAQNVYIYGLYKTHIPDNNKIMYNPDAKNGQTMFNNMRSVVIRVAKNFPDKIFTADDVKSIILNEMFFIRDKHKKDLRDGIGTTLGQLCKSKHPIIEGTGGWGNKVYCLK